MRGCGRGRGDARRREMGDKFIAGAIKKPGALHEQLGVPMGEKIPADRLAAAAKAGGELGQRARFAETLKGVGKGEAKGRLREAGERYEAEQHTPRGGAMKAEKVAADSAAFEAGQAARKARLADALKKKQTYQSELIRRAFGQDPDE